MPVTSLITQPPLWHSCHFSVRDKPRSVASSGKRQAGLLFLIKNGKRGTKNGLPVLDLRDGKGNMYSHGLAAIALCEAYAMTEDRALLPYAQASLNFIITAQCNDGGWRYSPNGAGGGDTSVVGWQLMALKSGYMGHLAVPPQTNQGSILFHEKVHSNGGAVYGYGTCACSVLRQVLLACFAGCTGWDKIPGDRCRCQEVEAWFQQKLLLQLLRCSGATAIWWG